MKIHKKSLIVFIVCLFGSYNYFLASTHDFLREDKVSHQATQKSVEQTQVENAKLQAIAAQASQEGNQVKSLVSDTKQVSDNGVKVKQIDLSQFVLGRKLTQQDLPEVQSNTQKALFFEKPIFEEDVSTATIEVARHMLAGVKNLGTLTENGNNVSKKLFGAPENDVHEEYNRQKNIEQQTRLTVHVMYNKLTSTMESIKRFVKGQKLDSVEFKAQFIQDLVQKQIDNHFGIDAKSGQSLFLLPPDVQKAVIASMSENETYKPLFDSTSQLTPLGKLNLLAQMSDEISNHVFENIATFATKFDDQGNYSSTMSSFSQDGSPVALTSNIDNKGNVTTRNIQVGNTLFTTTVTGGWIYGDYKSISMKSSQPTTTDKTVQLSSQDGEFLSCAWMAHKSMKLFKAAAKFTIMTGKQTAINLAHSAELQKVEMFALAVCFPVIKMVSLLPVQQGYEAYTGYNFSDPVMKTVLGKVLDLAVGENGQMLPTLLMHEGKPLMSGESDRVFTKGSWASKTLGVLQGKSQEELDKDIFDANERYYTWVDPIAEAIKAPLKALFPRTLGDQILSTKDISQGLQKSL